VAAWEPRRSHAQGSVKGRFATQDDSIKLTLLCPSMQLG